MTADYDDWYLSLPDELMIDPEDLEHIQQFVESFQAVEGGVRLVQDMIRKLESEDLAGYGSWPLPCYVDDEISKIINIFLASGSPERKAIYG